MNDMQQQRSQVPIDGNVASTDSVYESKAELPIGLRLPPPFSRLFISEFLRRTDAGGWLYALGMSDPVDLETDPMEGELDDTAASNE
jgi:hypothetical protein